MGGIHSRCTERATSKTVSGGRAGKLKDAAAVNRKQTNRELHEAHCRGKSHHQRDSDMTPSGGGVGIKRCSVCQWVSLRRI